MRTRNHDILTHAPTFPVLGVASAMMLASAPITLHGQDAESVIRDRRLEQNAAIAAADYDRVAALWIGDVTVTAGLGSLLRGSEAYRSAFEATAGIIYRRVPSTIEKAAQWGIAWEVGQWIGYESATGPEDPLIGGNYSAQWVLHEGEWLIRSELFVALTCRDRACTWPVFTIQGR